MNNKLPISCFIIAQDEADRIYNTIESVIDFVDEVIEHASVTQGEGIAIGHSFGATLSLLAEARQPGLFKNIILLDPPLFSRTKMVIISFLRKLGLEYLFSC